ncbi:MAG: toluene tolerance protein [Rhodospirillales bacterium]|jgi:phospholipid transport system substrate-binding protein|nr:toluene tolerance protein [Rhodospirillales bacterium]
MRSRAVVSFFLAIVFIVGGTQQLRAASASAVVGEFHDHLLGVMKEASGLSVNDRFERLSGPIDTAFDLRRMIRVAASPQWKTAAQAEQQRLFDTFRRLSIATYAAQFDGYSGQAFKTVGERPGPQQTILVATKIVESGGDAVGLTYVMKKTDENWLIADVLLDDSISQLAVRRSEYRRILKKSGIEGLVGTLSAKTDDLLID